MPSWLQYQAATIGWSRLLADYLTARMQPGNFCSGVLLRALSRSRQSNHFSTNSIFRGCWPTSWQTRIREPNKTLQIRTGVSHALVLRLRIQIPAPAANVQLSWNWKLVRRLLKVNIVRAAAREICGCFATVSWCNPG